MSRLIPQLAFGDLNATCVKYSPGGELIYILTANNCADESELVLNGAEAKALHEWLGRAVAASAQETGECPDCGGSGVFHRQGVAVLSKPCPTCSTANREPEHG